MMNVPPGMSTNSTSCTVTVLGASMSGAMDTTPAEGSAAAAGSSSGLVASP